MKGKLNHWLDVCRASAITLVLFSHGRVFLLPVIPDINFLKFGGFLGVELFFVLSGFLIGKILLDKINNNPSPFNWITGFWCRRWLRTYPSYLLFLVVNIALLFSIRPDLYPDVIRYLTFTQSLLEPHPSFFGEAWSLAVEEIFYLITPVTFAALMMLTGNKKLSLRLAIIILIALPFILRVNAALNSTLTFNEIRTISLFRIDSIMYGVLAVYYLNKYSSHYMTKIGLLLVPVCIYISAMDDAFLNNNTFLKVFLFPMANIGFACLIYSGLNITINSYIMSVLSRIARWSYAAYLTNLPVLFFIKKILPEPTTYIECFSQWSLFFILTLTSSYLIYSLFEKNILKIRDKLVAS